jgi:Protein of unknown function (DUF2752)
MHRLDIRVTARSAWLLATSAAVAAVPVLYRFNPLEVHFYPRCPLYVLTGIYCPGCGALRAGHALLHGRFLTALDYNALLVVAAPFLAWALAAEAVHALTGRRLPTHQLTGAQSRAVMWLFIAFMVLRNLPLYPLSVLAP